MYNTLNGRYLMSFWTAGSSQLRPISRLASKIVFSGLLVSWFLAASPISRSPSAVKATYEGVILLPWSLAMISTLPPLKTPTLWKGAKHEELSLDNVWNDEQSHTQDSPVNSINVKVMPHDQTAKKQGCNLTTIL